MQKMPTVFRSQSVAHLFNNKIV